MKTPRPSPLLIAIRNLDLLAVINTTASRQALEKEEVRSLALMAMRVQRLKRDRDPAAVSVEAKAGVIMQACTRLSGPWDITDDAFGGSDTARDVVAYAMPAWHKWLPVK
jgi:hypothetical protein